VSVAKRRFTPHNRACFIIRDHSGQALADLSMRRSRVVGQYLLTRDKARRIAIWRSGPMMGRG
jgi:hypothetical protein